MSPLAADRDEIGRFVETVFRHAEPGGFVSLRTFEHDGGTVEIRPVEINGHGLSPVIGQATGAATRAARHDKPCVFCPPVCTFGTAKGGSEADLCNGVALSLDCDERPEQARQCLEGILGQATVVVTSGGLWADRETGDLQPRMHLHWRLAEPTRDAEGHARLKRARTISVALAGGDTSNITLVHPLRWPGSWHRKSEAKLCRIVELRDEVEIDLADALERLEQAASLRLRHATGREQERLDRALSGRGNKATGENQGFAHDPDARDPDLEALADAIPNDDEPRAEYIAVGLGFYAVSDGSAAGFNAWDRWAQKSSKYHGGTERQWEHFAKSPPNRTGKGALVERARRADPGFRLPSWGPAKEAPGQDQPANDKADGLDIESFNAKLLVGTVPPIEWLVQGSFRCGELGLLAAMGAAGKSFLLLWLALMVIRPKGNLGSQNPIFGGTVAATGSVVLVCAEDSRNEIWRRLEALDPGGKIRRASAHNLYIVSVPDMGRPLFIVRTKGREIALDNGLDFIADFMGSVPDLAMVGIDPIQPLVGADLNVSAEAVQVAFNALAALAAKHRAAVIVAHHMRKNGAKDITSAEEAREAIRGSGDIVNRPRLSYALWPASKDDASKISKALDLRPQRNLVFHGAVVKANGVHNSDAQVYVRDGRGLLIDRTGSVRATRVAPKQIIEDFVRGVAEAATLGRPFTRTGGAGVFTRRNELPGCLRGLSRHRLEALVDQMLADGRLVRGIHEGTIPKWLDIPEGSFATGTGSFALGAPTGKSGRRGEEGA